MKPRLLIVVVAMLLALQIVAMQIPAGRPNQNPAPSFTYSPQIPAPDELITFNASASYDPDGSIVQYRWDFGDGAISILTGPVATHSYPVDGNYTVELIATDNSGAAATTTAVVQVSTVI